MFNTVVHDARAASSCTRSAARAIATASRRRTGGCLTATTRCGALWPDGFLPLIEARTSGMCRARLGAKGTVAGWRWDLEHRSTVATRSTTTSSNSNNASMGHASPTEFYAGRLEFGAVDDESRLLPRAEPRRGRPLRTAVGAEFRSTSTRSRRATSASWIERRQRMLDGPNANSTTAHPAPGAQVFPGFRPTDEQDETRNNYAVYVDLESDITQAAAARRRRPVRGLQRLRLDDDRQGRRRDSAIRPHDSRCAAR